MARRVGVVLVAAAMLLGANSLVPAQAEPPASGVPRPTVEGPITGGVHGHPWNDQFFEVESIGYSEEEYFLSGTARSFTEPSTTAEYKTRILVYRPSPEKFNGTTIVEWDNVTAQAAFTPVWDWTHDMILDDGYAFVFVSAQRAAVCCAPLSHNVWDPVRYGSLSIPDDIYSFDIYSQAIEAIRPVRGRDAKDPAIVDPMRGLKTKRVLAVGQSQSASRLKTYVDSVQPITKSADGFLIDAGGSKTYQVHPDVPVIHLLSEEGLSAAEPSFPGDTTTSLNYRLWEVPGGSHNDSTTPEHRSAVGNRSAADLPKQPYENEARLHSHGLHYGEEGGSASLTCSPVVLKSGNEYPRRYIDHAAIHHLDAWLRDGIPAPEGQRPEFDETGELVRDQFGHPKGGIRLPPLDVPVARYLATTCGLFGITVPLDPDTLVKLYPTHDDYVAKMQAATDEAVASGFLLPADAEELMGKARRSLIPSWPPPESPLS